MPSLFVWRKSVFDETRIEERELSSELAGYAHRSLLLLLLNANCYSFIAFYREKNYSEAFWF